MCMCMCMYINAHVFTATDNDMEDNDDENTCIIESWRRCQSARSARAITSGQWSEMIKAKWKEEATDNDEEDNDDECMQQRVLTTKSIDMIIKSYYHEWTVKCRWRIQEARLSEPNWSTQKKLFKQPTNGHKEASTGMLTNEWQQRFGCMCPFGLKRWIGRNKVDSSPT